MTAVQMGIVSGILAVTAGALFEVRPPDAYGVCMACHGRDLVNWTINALAGTHLTVAPASLVFPVLTPIGVLLGALLGAATTGPVPGSVSCAITVASRLTARANVPNAARSRWRKPLVFSMSAKRRCVGS